MQRRPSKPFLLVNRRHSCHFPFHFSFHFHINPLRLHLPVPSLRIHQPHPLSTLVNPTPQHLGHDDDVVAHLDALLRHEPAFHPPRSPFAMSQAAVGLDELLPAIVVVTVRIITGCGMALHKGVGDDGVFEAAGHEMVGAGHGRVGGGGESDVEGDVDVRGQRDGVEGGDEEADRLGEWLVGGVLFFDCWRGLDALGFRRGGGCFLFISELAAKGTGCDHGEGMRRGTHQVSDMSRDCRPSGFVSDRLTVFETEGGGAMYTCSPLKKSVPTEDCSRVFGVQAHLGA